jgi:hypothetical protein
VSSSLRRVLLVTGAMAVVGTGGYLIADELGSDDAGSVEAAGAAPGGSGATRSADPTALPPISTEPPPVVATDPPQESAEGGQVDVFLSVLEWDDATSAVQAGGYVAGVLELEGRCTLELTRGEDSQLETAAAQPDASTMSCGALAVEGDRISPGTWTAVLSYASDTAQGTSAPVEVDVP